MNHINLSDGELAALTARIQRNYDYDDRSGMLVNAKTGRMVKGVARDKKSKYISFSFKYLGVVRFINYHAAVWAWHNGCFPTMQIDHIDLDPTNNKIENLREVSQSENMMNMVYPWKPNADTGLPGVCKHGSGYRITVAHKCYDFRDRHLAFYHLTLLGRRYKEN